MTGSFFELLKSFFSSPHWYPAIPLSGFIGIAVASVGFSTNEYGSDGPSSTSSAWPAPMALALGCLCFLTGFGGYSDHAWPLIAFTVLAVVCGIAAANRDAIRGRIALRGGRASRIRDFIALGIGIIFMMLTLELSWNTTFPLLIPKCFFIELGLITCFTLSFYFLAQRKATFVWTLVLLAGFAGVCQYFLAKFKGVAILPSDLLAMPTALKVREGYSFILDGRGLLGPGAACISLLAFSLIGNPPMMQHSDDPEPAPHRSEHLSADDRKRERKRDKIYARRHAILRVGTNIVLGVAFALVGVVSMMQPNYIHRLGIPMDYAKSLESYKSDGFLTGFVAAAQDFPISVPKGYSRTKASSLQTQLVDRFEDDVTTTEQRKAANKQFHAYPPSIVMVLNESFADLSIFDGLGCGYEGPSYFKGIDDAIVRGNLAVSVIGGGTCNTEFEALTGNNYAFVGAGKYPYVTYPMTGDNLIEQLESLGYATHAIHPNLATNWNRDVVYHTMGFDDFIDIDSFQNAPQLHMGATDGATYDKVIELLKANPKPQFIFDVTMQNHGSYNLGTTPADKQLNYEPKDANGNSIVTDPETVTDPEQPIVTQEDVDSLNEYLACINASDEDLKDFLTKLKKLNQRVVVIFFGDHQPAFTPQFNDVLFAGEENQLEHQERVYQTGYFIWANYKVEGTEQKSDWQDASADMLGAMTLNLIGAPLSSYEKARMIERQNIVAINAFGYLGADGSWYASDDPSSPYIENYHDMAMLNYLNFGSRASRP